MTGDEIREAYLRFFEGKGHLRLPSSSLIPAGDPTLLLTNAGMVQMKPYFTGEMTPPASRLTTAQKCFRTTDIDSVGDSTHLTFFEMMGNFSVGDYFKTEAIAYAWEFVTERLGLARERVWVTVFTDDDEAHELWVKTGVPTERIRHFGEKDNFWGPAGNEGPCGPCSELHYDFGQELGCQEPDCGPNCENIVADTGLKCDRFVELWNLVFMQYYQAADGSRSPLPAPNIDTGMGLERAAVILQGKRSIYDTDLFAPLVQKVAELCGKQYGDDPDTDYAIRVVAEHARSAAFLISDGVVPGNDGRDYVLRRVIRRAIRYGKKLGLEATSAPVGAIHELPLHTEGRAVLPQVAEVVIDRMKAQYPDLAERREFILRVIGLEEERFGETLQNGINFFGGFASELREIAQAIAGIESGLSNAPWDNQNVDDAAEFLSPLVIVGGIGEPEERAISGATMARRLLIDRFSWDEYESFQNEPLGNKLQILQARLDSTKQRIRLNQVPGRVAFVLHATYGFPPELTEEIAKENGLEGIDWDAFQEEMRKHAETSRAAAGKFGGDFDAVRVYQELGVGATTFLGYETLSATSVVVGLLADGQAVKRAVQGEKVEVILQETPFYAEMGGQMGDAGEMVGQGGTLSVEDTQAPIAGLTVHLCTVEQGTIGLGDTVEATVDASRRHDTARNHTATHMLHAALREVLGSHVRQHGSLVTPDRLRFDFTHVSPLSREEMDAVQRLTNNKIRENVQVESRETTYRDAVSDGALAFFGDRYGDQVRVVRVASSPDPQGGTPFSMEVCGGTHVHRSGDIGLCYITSEVSIGSGLRRIEAVTGRGAEDLMARQTASLEEAAQRLQVPPDQLATRISSLLEEVQRVGQRSQALERELLKRQVAQLGRKQVAGVDVVSGELTVSTVEFLREAGDWLRNDIKSGVMALGAVLDGRPTVIVAATPDVVAQGFHAGNAAKQAAAAMAGGGGGRPELGQAGGKDASKLQDALLAAENEVRRWKEKS